MQGMSEALSDTWAIMREHVEHLPEFLRGNVTSSLPGLQAPSQKQKNTPKVRGKIAVLSLHGTVLHRTPGWARYWGANISSMTWASRMLDRLATMEDISAIVLDIDSPGGTVTGVPELASKIYKLRDQKPVIAVANGLAASAAYWIASAASELVVIPSGRVGSIGVYQMHFDYSKANEKWGVKPTYIYSGKYKVSGNYDEPLEEEEKTFMQSTVDEIYKDFVGAVAKYRGVTAKQVREDYGQGRVYSARQALEAGMVDKILTLEEVLKSLGGEAITDPEDLNAQKTAENQQLELMRLRWNQTKRKVS